MSAQDHLHPAQFNRISLDKLMGLPAIDSLSAHGSGTVESILGWKGRDIDHDSTVEDEDYGYQTLMARMEEEGQSLPVHVGTGRKMMSEYGVPLSYQHEDARHKLMLGNGGHRVAIARQLGWSHIAYSHRHEDTY